MELQSTTTFQSENHRMTFQGKNQVHINSINEAYCPCKVYRNVYLRTEDTREIGRCIVFVDIVYYG